ncbi:sugar phosphate isomerase/epimerase [Agromyces sp. SYSU K20354]|uniref:sugar phosphate isomerase/epimerase family protein n=1 Tax=Agromyces cavernae TaxID=2898659 RepID=UPI001E447288|nr:TIM barrel protein [Agromyces cavernae]MCD2443375.1 sugar phosphate isomerase/epimerase [Agromyces cavernae]
MSTLSVQLYSVRDALADDMVGTLHRLHGIGLRHVELFDFVAWEDRYAEALAITGLRAPSGHSPLLTAPDPTVAFDAAARLGVTTVIDPDVRAGWHSAAGIASIASRLNELVPAAADRGVTVGYHNHWWEFQSIGGRTGLEILAAELDPRVVLEVDTFWATVAGVDTPALLRRLGERVRFLHIKDGAVERDAATQQPAGAGAVNVRAVLTAAPDAIRVLEFDTYSGDIFEGVATSHAFVTETAATV